MDTREAVDDVSLMVAMVVAAGLGSMAVCMCIRVTRHDFAMFHQRRATPGSLEEVVVAVPVVSESPQTWRVIEHPDGRVEVGALKKYVSGHHPHDTPHACPHHPECPRGVGYRRDDS